MCEFDTYINTIIGNLRIDKNKKQEFAEEFKDHLELLKLEFVEKGFSDEESTKKAIERFGESSDIKKKLHKSLFGFRSCINILFGISITFIIIIFSYIRMTGVTIPFSDYNFATNVSSLLFANKCYIMYSVLFFIPIGYFLPIIMNRIHKVLQLGLTLSILGILIGACISIALISAISIGFLLIYLASALLGGMTGCIMLIAIDRLSVVQKNKKVTFK